MSDQRKGVFGVCVENDSNNEARVPFPARTKLPLTRYIASAALKCRYRMPLQS